MLKAYKYRLYPNKAQREGFSQHFGCARFVYNWVIEQRKAYYEAHKKTLPKRALQDKLVHDVKKEYDWLCKVNSQSLLAALGHAVGAFDKFFKKSADFPRFKSKKNHWQSYQCPQHVKVDVENQCVQVPVIGWVKANVHRCFEGKIKTCTIKRTPHGAYLISVLVEDRQALADKKPVEARTTRGVDVGLNHFLTTDVGVKRDNPRLLSQALPRLRARCKALSRKQKGSHNREKARLSVAKTHYNVARAREHFLHQEANQLLSDNQTETIAFEDLHIKGMLNNRKLARHIADVSWSRFVRIVEYKALWRGYNILKCHRFSPSSKRCHCSYINKSLTLADRVWTCPECNKVHDRDILASENIKYFCLAEAVGHTACVKPFPHDHTHQRECHGERSGKKPDGSQEAPARHLIATL